MSKRLLKISQELQQILSEAVEKEISDPRLELVTFTHCDVTPDLQHATIYFTTLKNSNIKAKQGLDSAKKLLRGIIGQKMRIKFTPQLHFKIDETYEESVKIEKLLRRTTINPREEVVEALKNNNNFVIASHVGPDGDSLGSTIALGLILNKLSKNVNLAFGDAKVNIPPQYQFLPLVDQIKSYKDCFKPDVFISLECPTTKRLGGSNKLIKDSYLLINIDHHGDNVSYGDINLIESDISSTAQMIFELSEMLEVELDRDIATNLYTGIVTDTGRFQYTNTSPATFRAAGELLAYGVDIKQVFECIYENRSFASSVLLGEILARARLDKDLKLIYSYITHDDFVLSGIDVGETEHFIDALRRVGAAEMAVIFKEVAADDIKVSLRSKVGRDVAQTAEVFGGGGHKAAAGFNTTKTLEETMNDLFTYLKETS